MKLILKALITIIIANRLNFSSALAEEKFLNNYQKLLHITEQFVMTTEEGGLVSGVSPSIDAMQINRGAIPCHVLGVRYNQSGPPWIVGARHSKYSNKSIADGIIDQVSYSKASFQEIHTQYYKDGAKRYYVPAYFMDMDSESRAVGDTDQIRAANKKKYEDYVQSYLKTNPNGEFVGYIAFRTRKVEEPFDSRKHTLVFAPRDEARTPGEILARPIKYNKVIAEDFASAGEIPVPIYKTVPYVTYEICFDPKPVNTTENINESIYSKFNKGVANLSGKYTYTQTDIPTPTMYRQSLTQIVERDLRFLDRIETATEISLVVLGTINPVAGAILTIRDVYQCIEMGDPMCYAHLATGNVSHLGGLLKLAKKSGSTNKIIQGLKKIDQDVAEDALLYTSIAGEVTLGALHARRGEYQDALGSMMGVTFEASPVLFGGAMIRVGYLGEIKAQCKNGVDNVNVISVGTNSNDFVVGKKIETDILENKISSCSVGENCNDLSVTPVRTGSKPAIALNKTPQEWLKEYEGVTAESLEKAIKRRFPKLPIPDPITKTSTIYRSSENDKNMGRMEVRFTIIDGPDAGYYEYRFHTPSSKSSPGTGPVIRLERAVDPEGKHRNAFRKGLGWELVDLDSPTVNIGGTTKDLLQDPDFEMKLGHLWVKTARTRQMKNNKNDPFNEFILQKVNNEEFLESEFLNNKN